MGHSLPKRLSPSRVRFTQFRVREPNFRYRPNSVVPGHWCECLLLAPTNPIPHRFGRPGLTWGAGSQAARKWGAALPV